MSHMCICCHVPVSRTIKTWAAQSCTNVVLVNTWYKYLMEDCRESSGERTMTISRHCPLPSSSLSLLIKQDTQLVLSFSHLNASFPLVCTILEAHKWNNLVLSVMAPQTTTAVRPCIVIVLETCLLKGTMVSETRHKALRFKLYYTSYKHDNLNAIYRTNVLSLLVSLIDTSYHLKMKIYSQVNMHAHIQPDHKVILILYLKVHPHKQVHRHTWKDKYHKYPKIKTSLPNKEKHTSIIPWPIYLLHIILEMISAEHLLYTFYLNMKKPTCGFTQSHFD